MSSLDKGSEIRPWAPIDLETPLSLRMPLTRGLSPLLLLLVGASVVVSTPGVVNDELRAGATREPLHLLNASNVAGIDDVNGDGHPDIIARIAKPTTSGTQLAQAAVIFGGPSEMSIDVANPQERGFLIVGGSRSDQVGVGLGPAGDVNGDGINDFLIGATEADNSLRPESGTVYVIFGREEPADVDLDEFDLGMQIDEGFRIDGAYSGDLLGNNVTGVSDVNGDGLSDVAVSTGFGGRNYVVFGKENSATVDLRLFDLGLQGPAGYVIETPNGGVQLGQLARFSRGR